MLSGDSTSESLSGRETDAARFRDRIATNTSKRPKDPSPATQKATPCEGRIERESEGGETERVSESESETL